MMLEPAAFWTILGAQGAAILGLCAYVATMHAKYPTLVEKTTMALTEQAASNRALTEVIKGIGEKVGKRFK